MHPNRTIPHNAASGTQYGRANRANMPLVAASKLLGPVVYAAQLPDGTIKIGHSSNLYGRLKKMRQRDGRPTLLALEPGTLDQEQALHQRLAPHRARAREYYHPTTDVMAAVTELRYQAPPV